MTNQRLFALAARTLLPLGCLFLFTVLSAQDADLLYKQGWQLVEDSHSQSISVDENANVLYFYADGTLLVKTRFGDFETTYQPQVDRTLISGQACKMDMDDQGHLRIERLADHRLWILEANAALLPPTQEEAVSQVGDFRLDGCYFYQEASEPVSYHYYRFYSDGSFLNLHTVIPPSEITPFLNKAYVHNEQEVRGFSEIPIEVQSNVLRYDYVASRRNNADSEAELIVLNRQEEIRDVEDSMYIHQVNQWSNSDRTFERDYTLAFLPMTELFSWHGESLSPGQPGTADALLFLPKIPAPEIVLKVVDEMPRFPGCEDVTDAVERNQCAQRELLMFIYSNISYPPIARENGVEGTAVITFVVEKDGNISNARIVRDPGAGCGQESLRVVKLMAANGLRWIPGKMYGDAVRVQFNLPVKFKLESRIRKKRRDRN